MNVLLVGLGRWGEKHLRVLRQLGATVWVADVAAARREWAIGQGVAGPRAVADFREALPHVDAVDVVTPADSHRAVAETCLAAGRHCFIEKPLTVSVADGRAVVEAARAAGRVVQVGHIFRFHAVTATLRAALAAMSPVRYTARTSKSRRTGIDFSTIGIGRSPGMITGWPAFRNVPRKSALAPRIAWLSSLEVK